MVQENHAERVHAVVFSSEDEERTEKQRKGSWQGKQANMDMERELHADLLEW